ncbi:hypothetical protein HBI56_038080 [Parastagonospora nodorum]|nr:hypothetical protein HBH53_014960 [Parastagonospora nodorum]KAH3986191.1 hypothetical protein HBH52_046120 [Parastagonospora nodorum]KAH3987914.1 hypothetical protein HBH51_002960 [Parastagonospora nodorum]KAH4004934.1 hypothetical protein HBI10_041460 [Parastagonospora nodorum]KAH4030789.1 hypothetical protein HBI13_024910 [Parastagonospora nodorum]
MGRFDTLNADTQDLVNCLLPALASSFHISDAVDIIPEDIRMRAWDCERRDHIKDETENDPRNWGVQFLKDLMAISRIKKGDLNLFQQDLRAKVAKHEEKHPWCRLSDIKELKDEYEHPNRKKPVPQEESGSSSTDSYLEELHEPELPSGMKRGRHEIYEARVQPKRRKVNRLRRSDDGGFERKDKAKARKSGFSMERDSPVDSPARSRPALRRPSRIIDSDGEEDARDSPYGKPSRTKAQTPSAYSMSPAPARLSSVIAESIDTSDQPLAVQKMEAELEVAEAELKAARLKFAYCKAKEEAEEEARKRQSALK